MRSPRFAAVVVAGTALTLACSSSSSTAPTPTFAGTWHVTPGTMNSGAITPSPFNVTVTEVNANSVTVVMPALTWSTGPIVYDSAAAGSIFSGSSVMALDEMHRMPRNDCDAITIFGNVNAARDTMFNAKIAIMDTMTVQGVPNTCMPKDSGTAVVVKQ